MNAALTTHADFAELPIRVVPRDLRSRKCLAEGMHFRLSNMNPPEERLKFVLLLWVSGLRFADFRRISVARLLAPKLPGC